MPFDPTISATTRLEATQLVAEYARLLDARDAGGWTALFTDRGVVRIGESRRFEGAEALAGFLARTPRGVHVPGVPTVEGAEDEVMARSAMLFLDAHTGGSRAVFNVDRLVRVADRLLIAERVIEIRADSMASGG